MNKKKFLIITDNGPQCKAFLKMLENSFIEYIHLFEFKKSIRSQIEKLYVNDINNLEVIDVKKDYKVIIENYSIVFSLHCKQIFPKKLVESVKCINIHPGYIPINKGWYPQVFAINYNLLIGATIHEMDEYVDSGNIIDRRLLETQPWETSQEVYENILKLEIELIKDNLLNIINNSYTTFKDSESEENFFSKEDFKNLCNIDLGEKITFQDAINRLRALTHGEYANAFYIDSKTNKKVYIKIMLSTR